MPIMIWRLVALVFSLCCFLLPTTSARASSPTVSLPMISLLMISPPVISLPVASLHTYNEKPEQTTFRSKQSLRDRTDRSWQIILFKRYESEQLQGLYLRLVGFPGLVTVDSKKPLMIATGSSLQWQATAELDRQTAELPDYAGQYNVATVLSDLSGDIPLQMNITLGDGSTAEIVVPPFAVHEWRELAALAPDVSAI